MKFLSTSIATVACLLVLLVGASSSLISATPLDDYVLKPDDSFKWEYTGHSFDGIDYMGYIYNMTSQTWLTPQESDRSVWWHHLVIIVPNKLDKAETNNAFLYITGGDNDHPNGGFPDATSEDVFVTAAVAVEAKLIGAVLYQVPNQPIKYNNDPWHRGGRSEDSAIALTWWQFMQNPSRPEVVLELPMTKAAYKALDAVQQIGPKYNGGRPINKFIISGASKRGYTAWLLAAVDKGQRVKVAIPIVLDAVNVHKFLHQSWQLYNGWSFALVDYWKANVTRLVDTPNFKKLMEFIDPWYYMQAPDSAYGPSRYSKIKVLSVNAVGDEFQTILAPQNWWKEMMANGLTDMIMVKNAEHSMVTGIPEVLTSVTAFAQGHLENNKYIPTYTWNISADGRIYVKTSVPPSHVGVSYADNAQGVSKHRCDFRWAAINATPCPVKVFGACVRPVLWWSPKTNYITKHSDTEYSALMPLPEAGRWRGFMIELRFKNEFGVDKYYFTSPVSLIPYKLPFPTCHGEGCYGSLV